MSSASPSSGCPIKRAPDGNAGAANGRTYYQYWTSWFVKPDVSPTTTTAAPTPLQHNPLTNDIVFGQEKQPLQTKELSTVRAVSSIPKGDFNPAHQIASVDLWVYPSEQQYFNAMKRKGYNPTENDVPVILAIHNLVNEQGWSKIREWEALRGYSAPKLKQFSGRPKDISPKAFLRSLIGYKLPFDRHDWVVDRGDGQEVRYVIDFYEGRRETAQAVPVSIYLDVRPALDSFTAVFDRIHVALNPSALKRKLHPQPAVVMEKAKADK